MTEKKVFLLIILYAAFVAMLWTGWEDDHGELFDPDSWESSQYEEILE